MTEPQGPKDHVVHYTDLNGVRQQTARTTKDHAYKLAATLRDSVVVHVGLEVK